MIKQNLYLEDDSSISDALHEECGVIGIFSFSSKDISPLLYRSLISLQHRGQDSAGISVQNNGRINTHKGLGMVSDIFTPEILESLSGSIGIAHVRYPTIGAGGPEDAQPFVSNEALGSIALAHNGNIANYGYRREILEKSGHKFCSTCDADLILAEFAKILNDNDGDIFRSVSKVFEDLDGSYSVCAITEDGRLVVFRDPNAIRPLCFGQNEDFIMFASESVALDINSIPLKGDVLPGEVLIISKDGIEKKVVAAKTAKRHCMFEYVYFSRPDSVQQGRLVYDVRRELGRKLAKAAPVDADIVVAVPDTSRPAAIGYSEQSGLAVVEGLIKNRYIGRTFIMPSQGERLEAVRLKLNAVKQLVDGKRIVLIDDSIVRGTTSGPIVKLLRDAGAKEIHLRIACPPVKAPCFYGVDIPTFDELIAAKKSVDEICRSTGADSLYYLSIDDLVDSIGMKKEELCLGCLNSDYPTEFGKKISKMIKEKGSVEGVRIWEEKRIE